VKLTTAGDQSKEQTTGGAGAEPGSDELAGALSSGGNPLSISVIIPAYNEEKYLPATLKALARQNYRKFEVIVVGNGCTDRTEEVSRPLCDRFLYLEEKGLSKARNLGGKKARGELLLFLDADTLLAPEALEMVASRFDRTCAAGTVKGKPDTPRLTYRSLYLLKNLAHTLKIHRGSSGVMLCWRDHFKEVDGFDEQLHVRENSDLLNRLARYGKYICINETAAVTSMRRYDQKGFWEMIWLWIKVWMIALFSDIRNRAYETVR
jgi:glycosyltransferase involved in cell wall biosynthesis